MKRNLAVIVAVVVIVALGAWGYSAYRTHTTRSAVTALVKDAAERLKPALSVQADAQTDFEAAGRALEGSVPALRKLDTESLLPLADAADGYLVSVREIVKRRAAMQGASARTLKELEALTQHLQRDRGAAGWPKEMVALRENVDREFREYRIAVESYAELLETLSGAQTKIAEHVNSMWTADEKTIREARGAALDALARTDENIRNVTQLDAYRGKRAPHNVRRDAR